MSPEFRIPQNSHTGRIVDFVIDEGKGEMKERILEVIEKWQSEMPIRPISVFDREGQDIRIFLQTNQGQTALCNLGQER